MLRNRPFVPSESVVAAHRIAPTDSSHALHRRARSSARLLVVPAASGPQEAVASAGVASLRDDVLRVSARRLSSFFAEAAVLVLVLGILERFLTAHHVELSWAGLILAISAALLAGSILLDVTGQRRSGHS